MERSIIERRSGDTVSLTAKQKNNDGTSVAATIRVTYAEYLSMCKTHGMEPMGPNETVKVRRES